MLYHVKPHLLNKGCPTPLWISCCNVSLACIRFLLDKLTPEQVRMPGPDGTTPCMHIVANSMRYKECQDSAAGCEIILYLDVMKLGMKDVLNASICFGNERTFKRIFDRVLYEENARDFAQLATLAGDTKILQLILQKFPNLERFCQKIGRDCHSKSMRQMLHITENVNSNSQLVNMSAKFPKFNEDIEQGIKPLSRHAEEIDIKRDIEPLLKETFCGLATRYGDNPQSMPISQWERSPCKWNHNG